MGEKDIETLNRKKIIFYSNMTKIIDLTYPLSNDTPTCPSSPKFLINERSKISINGRNTSKIEMTTHTGTHMDAPAHLFENGLTIDKVPVKKTIGTAVMLSLKPDSFGKDIYGLKDLDNDEERITDVEILIIRVGIEVEKDKGGWFFKKHPVPDRDVLDWIISNNIKCFGTDAVSVDKIGAAVLENHKVLIEKKIQVVEGLYNLSLLEEANRFFFMAIPMNIKGADGAPCRALAFIN